MEDVKKLLLRSYDATLSEEENRELKAALLHSEALRVEKEELDNMRTKLSDFEMDFTQDFTERLMQRIAGEKGFTFLSVFRAVAFSGVAAIILVLITVYFVDGSLNIDSLLGINGYAPDLGLLTIF